MRPRVRFAPSPTGFLHVGSARAALCNWLVARQSGGTLILRIEDTDTERGRREWDQGILDALDWLGLDWDEGPYRQSERGDLYAAAAERLLASGAAYWCDCAREDVDRRAAAAGRPPGYDRFCRSRGLGPGSGSALRFAVPPEGTTVVEDAVRGPVSFANAEIEDFVVVRSSGRPLFLLCNVVDDADMAVTDVIRGEDHLPNTPKYELLWEALSERPLPRFAHLPMLVNERRQKLSKRRDPVAVEEYRRQGYLPEAMCNYLALLGWGPEGDEEVLSREDLVAQFSLSRVSHSPAFFDTAKLRHFNGVWIRRMDPAEFVSACQPFLRAGPWPQERFDSEAFETLAPLVQERVGTLAEVPEMVDFLFLESPAVDEAAWAKAASEPAAAAILRGALESYETVSWRSSDLEAATRALADELQRPLRRAQAPLRVAVTGRLVGPPLFQSLEALGRDRVLRRLADALARVAGA
ncbi:MAG: glutamate--tRNA ligase [Acidimicrobiales bacterium]